MAREGALLDAPVARQQIHVFGTKAVAVAVSASFGLALLANLDHEAVGQHEVCAHGQRVHTSPGPHDVAPDRATAGVTRDSSQTSDRSHAHDHCMLSEMSRERVALPSAATVALAPPSTGPTRALASVDHSARGRAVYRLAPKSSPPV